MGKADGRLLRADNPRRLGILITDVRHPPSELDPARRSISRQGAFISSRRINATNHKTELTRAQEHTSTPGKAEAVIICSAEKRIGRDALCRRFISFALKGENVNSPSQGLFFYAYPQPPFNII